MAHTHSVFLSLGSNLGDKRKNLTDAITRINATIGIVERQSSFIETEPWGFDSDNTFLNAVIMCATALSPHELLKATQHIEHEMGRTHKSVNREYKDRIIDIDILLYDDVCINTPELTIPHPLMMERDFVMVPLNEIQ